MLTAAIVDDDRDTVDVFAEYLESFRVKVIATGYDGKDAVEIYKKFKPDILFLDLVMPQYDGIYALEHILADYPQAKIAVITSGMNSDQLKKISELRPTEIFYKPFDLDKIAKLLDKIDEFVPSDRTKAALISVTVEQVLAGISQATLEEVGNRLYSKYGSYFSDCLDHPEYLRDILAEIFGSGADAIVKKIRSSLAGFEDQQPIANFLSVIGS